jgi:hypothetical protein
MRLKVRDLLGTVLVLAIAIPYVGFLVRGEMPFIDDERGMSATGLILGVLAFAVMRQGDGFDAVGKLEIAVAVVSLALGVTALLLAETATAEVWLAVFMGSLLVLWAMELTDHLGVLPGHVRTG